MKTCFQREIENQIVFMWKVLKDETLACESQSKDHWIDRSVVLQGLLLNGEQDLKFNWKYSDV